VLLVDLLVLILVIGLIYWIATLLLPHPFPMVILVVGVVVLLIWLLQGVAVR
jgi:hypothetical protein